MESDPTPFMVNLFLFYMRTNGGEKKNRKELIQPMKFSNMFWFINALTATDDDDNDEFEKAYHELYPLRVRT